MLWDKVFGMIQDALCEGHIVEEYAWETVVLIPKRGGDSQGIGLKEFLWKTVMRIMNCRLILEIQFHNFLHKFRVGRGSETASLEANVLQHSMAMSLEVLYEIFLDIHKSYDALCRGHCLDTLAAYGLGPQSIPLFWRYWDRLIMVSRVSSYFGANFKGQRSMTQTGPPPPIIFNVVVDAVLQHWVTAVAETEETAYPSIEGLIQDF